MEQSAFGHQPGECCQPREIDLQKGKEFSPLPSILASSPTHPWPTTHSGKPEQWKKGRRREADFIPFLLRDLKLWLCLSHEEGRSFDLDVRLKTKCGFFKHLKISLSCWNEVKVLIIRKLWSLFEDKQSSLVVTAFRLLLVSFSKSNIPTFEKKHLTKAVGFLECSSS